MEHKIGVHWIPVHSHQPTISYIEVLKPRTVKIVNYDVSTISKVYRANPKSLICLRDHPRSEQKADMIMNPIETGIKHAFEFSKDITLMRQQAKERNIPFPEENESFVCHGINEPPVWSAIDQTVAYTSSFLETLEESNLRGAALNLSVGWPSNTGKDTPPDWSAYSPLEQSIKNGNHFLCVHEYWDSENGVPNFLWGWWANRIKSCPFDVPIIIGECGVDRLVSNANIRSNNHRGWALNASRQEYLDQIEAYLEVVNGDDRINSFQIFTSDYSQPWSSFSIETLYGGLIQLSLKRPDTHEKPKVEPERDEHFWPVDGEVVHSFSYPEIPGVDISTDSHKQIRALFDGIVKWSGYDADYGWYLRIWHSELKIHTFYANMLNKSQFTKGTHIRKGDVLGLTSSVFHFQIRLGNEDSSYIGEEHNPKAQVDPELFLKWGDFS